MSDSSPASWQPDPYGRFAQRYWDGSTWTANVADAAGRQSTDPPVASAAPAAGYPTAGYATTPAAATAARAMGTPVAGLVVAGIGALCVILSDFVLAWFSFEGHDLNLSDLRDLAGNVDVPFLSEQYLNWGWIAGLAA